MSTNTKIRLAVLASSVALAVAAPAAFAMVGGTFSSSQTTKTDTTSKNNTEQATPEKLVPVGAVPETGTSSHSPAGGTTDATRHKTKKVKHIKHMKHKKMAPSDPDATAIQQQPGVPKN